MRLLSTHKKGIGQYVCSHQEAASIARDVLRCPTVTVFACFHQRISRLFLSVIFWSVCSGPGGGKCGIYRLTLRSTGMQRKDGKKALSEDFAEDFAQACDVRSAIQAPFEEAYDHAHADASAPNVNRKYIRMVRVAF